MTFAHIPANVGVFIDANVLIYYFAPDPVFGAECQLLMERLSSPELLANIGSIIREVNSLDESSTTFRYALDPSGNVPLGDKQHIILDKVYCFMLPLNVWFGDMIYHSDVLAGPTPGLEPNWLYLLEAFA